MTLKIRIKIKIKMNLMSQLHFTLSTLHFKIIKLKIKLRIKIKINPNISAPLYTQHFTLQDHALGSHTISRSQVVNSYENFIIGVVVLFIAGGLFRPVPPNITPLV